MKTSQEGIDLIKKYEGFRSKAYKCPAGVWTIGWGTTKINGQPVKEGMTCTKEQATEYLKADLEKFENHVMKYNGKYNWTQNEFNAMVSFAYNIGSIDKLTASGTRTKKEVSEKITAYNKAGGKILSGLVARRNEEKKMFDKTTTYPVLKKGCKGDYVKLLQTKLNDFGFNLEIDGIFGIATQTAVIGFQGSKNIVKDGIVGTNTWKALLLVLTNKFSI